ASVIAAQSPTATPDCATTGFIVAEPPPNAIALADLDGGAVDMVAGAAAASGSIGTVTFYKDLALTGTPTSMVVPAPAEDNPSFLRGNRIKIGDLDGDGKPEIVVADSGASLQNVNESGQVWMYKFGTCSDPAGKQRGPFCLVNTLSDTTPSNKDQFGRAMT